jgi:hypothetical protein
MKKILLILVIAVATLGATQQSKAQCAGAVVLITNVSFNQSPTHYIFSFQWTYLSGNPSLQVRFRCGGVYTGVESRCLPKLTDSAAGPHFFKDSFLIATTPCAAPAAKEIVIGVWTSSNCNGLFCPSTSNISLPVKFGSFKAVRNGGNVNITWSTVSELNNQGFAIERNTNGSWEQVGYVASQALNGSSDAPLSYAFVDQNSFRGVTQYRIRQVDIDAKATYTTEVSVRGEGQLAKTMIFPNPTSDGRVKIVFEDVDASRSVTISDFSGRVVRQYKGITNNNLIIENLQPGMYTLAVMVPETGEQVVQKIVVNKR